MKSGDYSLFLAASQKEECLYVHFRSRNFTHQGGIFRVEVSYAGTASIIVPW